MTDNQVLGKKGEDLAVEYYRSLKFDVLEKNWRSNHLEVDLIVSNADFVVFCEVKTRSSTVIGNPEEFVNAQKQNNLIRAANNYILRKGINKEVRFDIIAIVEKSGSREINHIPDAFKPRW